MADTYTTTLKNREEIAENTMAFWFQRPEDFSFEAGQHGDFILQDPPHTDDKGNRRTFSFASSPNDDDLLIATRMRENSAFKQSLAEVPIGTELQLEGPWGDLTLHDDSKRPGVFLIGGIGITPVRSILQWATEEEQPHDLFLFYSNRTPDSAAFVGDLNHLERQNPTLDVILTMTEVDDDSNWQGDTTLINEDMIHGHMSDDAVDSAVFYLVGPPTMVQAMRKLLDAMGIDDMAIKTEEFSGY